MLVIPCEALTSAATYRTMKLLKRALMADDGSRPLVQLSSNEVFGQTWILQLLGLVR